MNLSKNFLIKCAGCLLAVAALAITTSCAWMEGDLLDLSGGEPADITIDQLYQRMSAATDPEGVYAKAKSYRLIQEVESVDGNSKNRDYYSTVVLFKQPDFIIHRHIQISRNVSKLKPVFDKLKPRMVSRSLLAKASFRPANLTRDKLIVRFKAVHDPFYLIFCKRSFNDHGVQVLVTVCIRVVIVNCGICINSRMFGDNN